MMGWPMLPSVDLYAGGPAYPLSSLGVRLPAPRGIGPFSILAGVFNDNPPGGSVQPTIQQVRGAEQSGTKFNFNTGALVIAELQYRLNQPCASARWRGPGHAPACPAPTSSAPGSTPPRFPDQRFDTQRASSLADPAQQRRSPPAPRTTGASTACSIRCRLAARSRCKPRSHRRVRPRHGRA